MAWPVPTDAPRPLCSALFREIQKLRKLQEMELWGMLGMKGCVHGSEEVVDSIVG